MKPATFDMAVGIFLLSLIPWLPASGFIDSVRRRWRQWMGSSAPVDTARRWVHIAGAAWAAVCVAVWTLTVFAWRSSTPHAMQMSR
jgi:hypothetical protein